VEGGDGDRKPACTFFEKKDRESLYRLSVNEFKLTTNNMLGYDMSRVKLKIIGTARFCIDSLVVRLSPSNGLVPDWGGILENWADYCRIKM